MRSAHLLQPSLFVFSVPHSHARELHDIATLLDSLPELESLVLSDLLFKGSRRDFGRSGLSAQQVLRIFVLYLLLKTDFEQLAFHLADSPTYRAFCLLGLGDDSPKRSTLHQNLSLLRGETLAVVHRLLVGRALSLGIERATAIRTDTTPVAAVLRSPNDSILLGDAVRVLDRLLCRTRKFLAIPVPNHRRRVRNLLCALRNGKLDEEDRADLYFDLLQDVKRYVEAAIFSADYLDGCSTHKAHSLGLNLRTQAEKALCICDQTERRVLQKESVPATDKRVSFFETHANILCKRDEVVYGHKVCLSFGKTGLVLGAQILQGTPADAQLAEPALEEVIQNTGKIPHDMAMDLGFASKGNVVRLKELGVHRIAFPAGRGIDAEKACGNRRIRRKLYRFRAGAEALISWLKRSLAMGQSRWRGDAGFSAYVWGVIVTASLQAIVRAG